MSLSICSRFTTFLKATLLSILTFFLGLFVRSPAFHAPSVTPYPLAPHLEGRILDIGRDTSIDAAGKAMDLEMGFGVSYCRPATAQASQNNLVSHGANKTSGAAASSTNVSSKPLPRARAHTVHHHPSAFNSSPIPKLEREITHPAPLSVATNFARVPGPPSKTAISRKIRDENKLPTPAQPSRKQPPRYLNLGVSSPTKPAKKQYPRHGKSLGSNIIKSMDRDTPSQLAPSPLFPTPLKLEAGSIPGDSQDWAARIRSVLYKTREGDEDLAESVRNLFNRDSVLALDPSEAVDIIEDRDLNLRLDDEVDFGRRFRRVDSTFCFESPSGQTSSSDESFDGPTTPSSPPPCSWSSGLPYLLERSTHLSLSPSLSADAFNDLLASVERKYPGRDWKDVVEFAADKGADGAKSCVGGQQRGSDVPVFCAIDQYSS
ncbi:hypothetical protein DFH06DRAFT_1189063 [Mycena polygramma]|nr:hypothetical protein DFH06DRAFT_1189063 [Mycena polygramma]